MSELIFDSLFTYFGWWVDQIAGCCIVTEVIEAVRPSVGLRFRLPCGAPAAVHAYTPNEILLYLVFFYYCLVCVVFSLLACFLLLLSFRFLFGDFMHSDRLIPIQRCSLTQRARLRVCLGGKKKVNRYSHSLDRST